MKVIMFLTLILLSACCGVYAQDSGVPGCYNGGSVAGAAVGSFIGGIILAVIILLIWDQYKAKVKNGKHLVLSTDPESVKDEFAFDNPGFHGDEAKWRHEAPTLPLGGIQNNTKQHPLAAQFSRPTDMPERHVSKDDLSIEKVRLRQVQLWARDFTGLGLTITGGARSGVLVNSVLRAGPAAACGIQPGDKIKSVKITLTGAILEDTSQILSLASPYPVELEIEPGTSASISGNLYSMHVRHPILRRAGSFSDVHDLEKELKHLRPKSPLGPQSNTSTLETKNPIGGGIKKIEKMITSTLERAKKERKENSLERENEKNTRTAKNRYSDITPNITHSKQEATRQRNSSAYEYALRDNEITERVEHIEMQKKEADAKKGMKFGIRVLPPNLPDNSNKKSNENGTVAVETDVEIPTVEVTHENEVKKSGAPVVARRRDKTAPPVPNVRQKSGDKVLNTSQGSDKVDSFTRDELNSSGIKRDKNGIPQELPQHMIDAALCARSNRKSDLIEKLDIKSDVKTQKKSKGKAPSPPDYHKNRSEALIEHMNHVNKFLDNEILHSSLLLDSTIESNKSFNTSTPRNVKSKPYSRYLEDSINFTQDDIDDIVTKPFKKETDSLNNYYEDSKSNLSSNNDGHSMLSFNNSDKDPTAHELTTSDITLHSASINETVRSASDDSTTDDNERKAASLGDLSRFDSSKVNQSASSQGTLERAQSLDITGEDAKESITPKKRKSNSVIEGHYYEKIDHDILPEIVETKTFVKQSKEPRLSLNIETTSAIEGLNTFQRNRLKKGSEFGNLADAIVKGSDTSLEVEHESNENLYKYKDYDNGWKSEEAHTSDELAKKAIEENTKTNFKLVTEFAKTTEDEKELSIEDEIYKAEPATSTFGTSLKYEVINDTNDINIPDDVKVSRHTLVSSLERPKSDMMKKLLAKNPVLKTIEQSWSANESDETLQTDNEKNENKPDLLHLSTFKPAYENNDYVRNIKINNKPLEDPNIVTIRTDPVQPKQIKISSETKKETFVKSIAVTDIEKKNVPGVLERIENNQFDKIVDDTLENVELNPEEQIDKNVSVNIIEDDYGNKIITKNIEQISTQYIGRDAPLKVEQISFGIIKNPTAKMMSEIQESENLSEFDERVLEEIKKQQPELHFTSNEPSYTKTETILLNTHLDEDKALALMDKLKNDPEMMSKSKEELASMGVTIIQNLNDFTSQDTNNMEVTKARYAIDTKNIEIREHESTPDIKLRAKMKNAPDEEKNAHEQNYITEIQVRTPKTENSSKKHDQPLEDISLFHDIDKGFINDFILNEKRHTEQNIRDTSKRPNSRGSGSRTPDNLPRNNQIKFRTSTYESPKGTLITSTDRKSQIDSIRSTFEKDFKPAISAKPSNIPIKTPEKLKLFGVNSKIPVFNKSLSQESLNEKSLTVARASPTKNEGGSSNVSVTSIKSSSKHPSGI